MHAGVWVGGGGEGAWRGGWLCGLVIDGYEGVYVVSVAGVLGVGRRCDKELLF